MYRVNGITADPHQSHTLLMDDRQIVLTLRFLPVVQSWFMSLAYEDWRIDNIRLALNVSLISQSNQPFDFVVTDTDGLGVDPMTERCFETGRIELYFATAEELQEIRKYEVRE